MDEGRFSVTALVNAYVRAHHALYVAPKIFDDPIARRLFTDDQFSEIGKKLAAGLPFFNPQLAASCSDEATALALVMRDHNAPIPLSRARYCEDELAAAVKRGVRQYVILGAGMDTFAFRRPADMQHLHVFEVDHPSTQELKRFQVARLEAEAPAQVSFVPLDFSKESLQAALLKPPYDPDALTFVNWSGVTYYLDRDTVFETLRALAAVVPAGSTLVFDYLDPDAFIAEKAALRVQRMLEITRRIREPMKTSFDPPALPAQLARTGWRLAADFNPSDIEQRYFQGRSDGYHAFEHVHFARAVKA